MSIQSVVWYTELIAEQFIINSRRLNVTRSDYIVVDVSSSFWRQGYMLSILHSFLSHSKAGLEPI